MFKNLNNIQKIFVFIFTVSLLLDLAGILLGSGQFFGHFFTALGMFQRDPDSVGLIVYVCCIVGFFLFRTKNKTQD